MQHPQCNLCNSCLRSLRNTKKVCGGVNTYQSSLSDVGCCGDDGARNRVSLMYLFCEESNVIQVLRARTILIILTLGLLVLFFLITYHLFIVIPSILRLDLLVLFFLVTYHLFIIIRIILRLGLLVLFF